MTEPSNNVSQKPGTAWVLTDGKAGDRVQCLGVLEALSIKPLERVVNPGKLFAAMMPRGPIPQGDAPEKPGSPIAPPFPDLVVASGRRAVAYLRAVKAVSPKTFTVFLKDPRTGTGAADFIWVPKHDKLDGDNVLRTLTSPHRFSSDVLAGASDMTHPGIDGLSHPRCAVLIGGDSTNHTFKPDDIDRLEIGLREVAQSGWSLMGTMSRRTENSDPDLPRTVQSVFGETDGFLWDGRGDNPYPVLLAKADAFIVTADSVNMIGEAAATGKPIHIFHPSGGSRKMSAFIDGLKRYGAVHDFVDHLETRGYQPLDSTPEIARELLKRYAIFKSKQAD